jgi:hypothetical protein
MGSMSSSHPIVSHLKRSDGVEDINHYTLMFGDRGVDRIALLVADGAAVASPLPPDHGGGTLRV